MDGAVMEVNLCPSSNSGKASCSILTETVSLKTESEAIVNLDHTVAAVCPINGQVTIITEPKPAEPTLFYSDAVPTTLKRKCPIVNYQNFDFDNKKSGRRNKLWLQENMTKAIQAVKNGMHVRTASKQFSVPRTTLKYKLCSCGYKKENEKSKDSVKAASCSDPQTQAKEVGKKDIEVTDNNRMKYIVGRTPSNPIHTQQIPKQQSLSGSDMPSQSVSTAHKDIIKIPVVNKCITMKNSEEFLKTINKLLKKDKSPISSIQKKCKQWSEETMKQAVEAVNKGSKIKDAAVLYGIPHSTLGSRVLASRRKVIIDKGDTVFSNTSTNHDVITANLYTPILPAPPKYQSTKDPVGTNSTQSTTHPTNSISPLVATVNSIGPPASNIATLSLRVNTLKKSQPPTKLRGKIKQWTEESMGKALKALNDDGLSVYAAAKKYNVPKSTLDARKKRRDGIDTKFLGPEIIISSEDEYPLVCYVNVSAMFGITNIKNVVLLLAAESAEKQGLWNIKEKGLPPEAWWNAFCIRRSRHIKNVDITAALPIRLTKTRLGLFFDKLSAVINSSQFHKRPLSLNSLDQRAFTAQEFKFDMNAVASWMNGESHKTTITTTTTNTINNNNNNNNNNNRNASSSTTTTTTTTTINKVSTVCCVNASGTSLPPMFVIHTENEHTIPVDNVDDAHYFVHNVNDKSRDSDFYYKWFNEVFLRYAPTIRPLILLLDPDTSFITPEFITLANKNQIILLCLPPLSAHLTQPLNTSVFPALKQGFKTSFVKNYFIDGVNCNNFPCGFKLAWNSLVDVEVIKSGFAKTGIYPLNRRVFEELELPAA